MNWEYTKQFWIKTIEEARSFWQFPEGEEFSIPNWEDEINKASTCQTLNELGRKLRKEASSKAFLGVPNLATSEERELIEAMTEDTKTLVTAIEVLKSEYKASKSSSETYENEVKEFQDKVKVIIGNDLTNWETKIQKKISGLTTEKDNLDQQLKDKQQQILDHRCDTPNNTELNQIKKELDKANQEITSLKEQLGNKPNLPNNKEEDKKEELENSKLTLEQLREKLKSKQEEIKSLRIQLQKSRDNHHNRHSLGTLFLVGVVGLLFGSLIMFIAKKKKKQTL